MNKKIVSLVAAALSIATFSIANTASAAWWTFTPTSVGCFDDGTCFIDVTPDVPASISNCATKNQVRFMITKPGGDGIYKTALAAFMGGKKLAINVGNTDNCISGYPGVWYLRIVN